MPSLSSIKQQAAANESLAVGASIMAVGNTSTRPDPASTGQFRMNSETGEPEWYDETSESWFTFSAGPSYDVEMFAWGGGGSGYSNPSLVTSATLTAGSDVTPGNASDSLRNGAGQGGASGVNNGTGGVFIIRYPGAQRGTGGTVSSSGGYTYHTYTASGNYVA